VDVTQQQAVPYQFFQGTHDGGLYGITWPDQYEGMVTHISCHAESATSTPVVQLVDGSDVLYAGTFAVQCGDSVHWLGSWEGESVLPAGSELQIDVNGSDVQICISGWLMNPTGSQILSE
jgi:hypothetical protein